MKYIFTILLSVFLLLVGTSVSAAVEDTSLSGWINTATETTLSLVSLNPVDTLHVNVTFSEAVDIKTMRLKIAKQSDNSTLRIASLTGSTQDSSTVVVTLETDLQEWSAYTLTVVSAIGQSGAVITDGALALRDFITPVPLKKYEIEMNAPSNPNAVLVQSATWVSSASGLPNLRPVNTATGKEQAIPPSKELPLTGMNPLFLLFLILPITFFFVRKKTV